MARSGAQACTTRESGRLTTERNSKTVDQGAAGPFVHSTRAHHPRRVPAQKLRHVRTGSARGPVVCATGAVAGRPPVLVRSADMAAAGGQRQHCTPAEPAGHILYTPSRGSVLRTADATSTRRCPRPTSGRWPPFQHGTRIVFPGVRSRVGRDHSPSLHCVTHL